MGAFCGCCSRNHAAITTDTSQKDDERQSMLDAADFIKKSQQKQQEIMNKNEYGSTDDIVSYQQLKFDNGQHKTDTKTKNIEPKEKEDQKEQPEQHNKIPVSKENIILSNAGFDETNGDYRWFVHNKKWCLFRETQSYSMENGVSVDDVYQQLTKLGAKEANFRWNDKVKECWIISNMAASHIYYAAPQHKEFNTIDYIPSNNKLWISVHGSSPGPEIYPNLMEESKPPDNEEEFGNVPLRDNKTGASVSSLQSVKEADNPKDETSLENDNDDDDDGKEKEMEKVTNDDEDEDEDEESLSDLD